MLKLFYFLLDIIASVFKLVFLEGRILFSIQKVIFSAALSKCVSDDFEVYRYFEVRYKI